MKIFFASSNSLAIPIAKTLLNENLITGFISNPDKPTGRKQILSPNSFVTWADKQNIPLYKESEIGLISNILENERVDLVITCAYGLIIREKLLQIPKFGWLNIHFSLLPKYRGAAPAQRAIMNGDKESGFTIFKLDSGIDTGEILYQEKAEITPEMKCSSFLSLLADKAAESLPRLINNYDQSRFRKQQGEATFAPKISKSDNQINWSANSRDIFNKYRALDLNGGVFTNFRGNKLIITKLSIAKRTILTGEIKEENGLLLVGTGDGALSIESVKPEGKIEMSIRDWINGARLKPGERFE